MAKLTPESAWEFADAIKAIVKPQTTRRKATVQNVDKDGTIWVSLPGSSTVTPIQSTGANVSPGDTVLTELRGTSLHITENQTNPAIGENTARSIARQETQHAEAMAKQAKTIADEANAVAEATNQHFFADDNGAHITDVTQDEWTQAVADNFSDYDPDTKPYHNQLLNSLGILLRTALNNLVSITRSAIAFYDGQGNAASNIVARFGSDGAQIGLSTTSNIRMDSSGFEFTGDDGGLLLDIGEADETMELTELLEYAEVRESIAQGEAGYVDLILPAVTPPTGASLISYAVNIEFYRQQGSSPSKTRVFCDPGADLSWAIVGGITVAWSHASRTVRLTTTEAATQYGPVSVSSNSYYILAVHNGAFVQIGTQKAASTTGAATLTVGEGVLASGNFSQAVGQGSGAMGDGSFATGHNTRAWGDYSHAEGVGYYGSSQYGALGTGSHSEGHNTRALGDYSHAQNLNAVASGKGSHAQNDHTIAASDNQTAIGKYNVEDTNDKYALIIGNGTADNDRSNAFAVTWDGDIETPGGSITPVVLYDDDSTALNVPITLSETAANFDRLTICYKSNDNDYASVDVWHPNGKTVSLTATRTAGNSTTPTLWLKSKTVLISGTTINTANTTSSGSNYYRTSQTRADGNQAATQGDYIAITQVIGYR